MVCATDRVIATKAATNYGRNQSISGPGERENALSQVETHSMQVSSELTVAIMIAKEAVNLIRIVSP